MLTGTAFLSGRHRGEAAPVNQGLSDAGPPCLVCPFATVFPAGHAARQSFWFEIEIILPPGIELSPETITLKRSHPTWLGVHIANLGKQLALVCVGGVLAACVGSREPQTRVSWSHSHLTRTCVWPLLPRPVPPGPLYPGAPEIAEPLF